MKKVAISNKEIFPIGLGTSKIGDNPDTFNQEVEAIRTGIVNGVQLIDTAEMYGDGNAERLVGHAIKPFAREDSFIVSKVLPNNASKKQIPISIDDSLKRMQLEYIDLYLLHWKSNHPLEETIEALETAKSTGKIKAWGVSNFDVNDMEKLVTLPNGIHCTTNQVRYNISDRGIEYDLVPLMNHYQMPIMAYAPLSRGDQLGAKLTAQQVLIEISQKYNADVFQILLAWCIRNGQTIAIPRSGKSQHVLNNVKAAFIKLSKEDLAKIDTIYPPPTKSEPLALW